MQILDAVSAVGGARHLFRPEDVACVQLTELIDARYRNVKPTALISNLALPGIRDCLGERAYDRLREAGPVLIKMKGQSWRSRGVRHGTLCQGRVTR